MHSSTVLAVYAEKLLLREFAVGPSAAAWDGTARATPRRKSSLVLYDFNQEKLRRAQAGSAVWPAARQLPSGIGRAGPSTGSALFEEPLDGLKCLRMVWPLPESASSDTVRDILMDESHVVVMLVRSLIQAPKQDETR